MKQARHARCVSFDRVRDRLNEQRTENEDCCREQLNDDMERRPCSVLERVADGVAGNGRLVRLAVLSAVVSELDVPERLTVQPMRRVCSKRKKAINVTT